MTRGGNQNEIPLEGITNGIPMNANPNDIQIELPTFPPSAVDAAPAEPAPTL
jgi:hypothetical protein